MPKHKKAGQDDSFEDEYPDPVESLEPQVSEPLLFVPTEEVGVVVSAHAEKSGKHGNRKVKPELNMHQRKSRRMRIVLIVVVFLLIVLIGALGYYTWMLFAESQNLATQQTQQQQDSQDVEGIQSGETKDATTSTTKKTEVPKLTSLVGLTQETALTALAHGATVSSTREVNEEGNPVKASVTIALTDEPSDTRSGTPTVYLGLDEGGVIVTVGYSAATASLGYGSLSFADAVNNERIVEKTLAEAGISVAEGSVVLPKNKAEYSTYATDGTTLENENCSFSGVATVDGVERKWSAVLRYDYKLANASGNLADTIRQIYIYLNE